MSQSRGTYLKTGNRALDSLVPKIRDFLEQDRLDVLIDGKHIRGYRAPDARSIWIRDYSDMLRGIKYFESDLTSTVQHFADTQAANGRIFDYFTTFPEKLPGERENWTKYVRVPVEADVEFRFVKAAFLAWQAAGDDDWIISLLPAMERALDYVLTHPWRWDQQTGLVKRPYTIDTWDFAYTAGSHDWLQFQIDDNTFWGIMHGDNSGYYEAFRIMQHLYSVFGDPDAAQRWADRAHTLRDNLNRVCWNGRFYTHFVKLIPVNIPGVDETQQLSLSNPMDINRGVTDHSQAAAILREYRARREKSQAFAEWFSIDPPFPDGRPSSRESSTSPEATSTDGWGSSAVLYALIEGLAGVQDKDKLFQKIRFAPRWPAARISQVEARVEYASSGAFLDYRYSASGKKLSWNLSGRGSQVEAHILLPSETSPVRVRIQDRDIDYDIRKVEQSLYVDFSFQFTDRAVLKIDIKRQT